MHGDHIHIALTGQHIFFPAGTGIIQSVQIAALVKDQCFRRIQVFRCSISHNASAKADDAIVHVHDREHNAVPELVMAASLFHGYQAAVAQYFVCIAPGAQILIQVIAGLIGKPQSKPANGIIRQFPSVKIIIARLALRLMQLVIKIISCQLVDLQKSRTPVCFRPLFFGILHLRQMNAGPVCQHLQSLRKGVILIFHHERNDIAPSPAPEAVIHLLLG